LPEWEVKVDGRLAGWVQEKHLRGARNVFYGAHVLHPTTGRLFDLNVSTDYQERVESVVSAWLDPSSHKGHRVLPRG
jgi:hypothetical protein